MYYVTIQLSESPQESGPHSAQSPIGKSGAKDGELLLFKRQKTARQNVKNINKSKATIGLRTKASIIELMRGLENFGEL